MAIGRGCCGFQGLVHYTPCTEEEIRCVFDDNSKIIFVKSSKKPMLWVLIRIALARRFK